MAGIWLGRNRFSELHDQWIDGFGVVHPFSLLPSPDLLFPLVSVEHPEAAHGGRRQLSRLAASASQGEKESRSLGGGLYPCWFLFLFAADVGNFRDQLRGHLHPEPSRLLRGQRHFPCVPIILYT